MAVAKPMIRILAALVVAAGPSVAQAQTISLLRDAEIETFLEDYAHPIFRAAGLHEDSVEILLVNDGSFNAFAAGSRYMGLNTGLLTTADTPNQIEAVIAHETGHIAGGHSARTQDAMSAANVPMLLGLILAAGAVAAGAPDAGIGILGLGQNIGMANFLRYSRGQESTADQASITYLDAVGHSSNGALEIWRKMRNAQIIRDNVNPYLQSHPMANERLTALQERAQSSPYFDVEDSPEDIERLKLIQAKIYGFLHDPNATMRRYPPTDQSAPAHYGRALAYYRTSQIEKALSEIRTLTEARSDNPYFFELEGQMLFEFGRADEAIAPHRRAVELHPDNALLRINLGRTLLAARDPANHAEAAAELKRALLLEPENSFGWSELARAYASMDNETLAILATAEARFHAGVKEEANLFARRAMQRLDPGSREWRQAADIILATQPEEGGAPLPPGMDEDNQDPAPKAPQENDNGEPDTPDPIIIRRDAL